MVVLGVLIARASGKPFETFPRERVLEPVDMTGTAFCVPAASITRLVTSYLTDPQTGAFGCTTSLPGSGARRRFPPAVPGWSTATGYLAFAQMLLRGGAPLLPRPSVQTMATGQLTPSRRRTGLAGLP